MTSPSFLGGLVFECLAALRVDMKSDFHGTKGFAELKQEETDHHYDDKNDEVFSLELERSERGLGLALVDTEVCERAENEVQQT